MSERRGPWYLVTGLILGAVAGLLYAWLISPVHYVATSPSSLRADFKDSYRLMIALSYAADGDIGRASSRLSLLGDPRPSESLAAQAQQILAQGGSQSDARVLAVLAMALAQQPTTTFSTSATAQTSTPARLPTSTLATATFGPSLPATQTLTPAITIVTHAISPSPQVSPTQVLTPTKRTGTPLSTLTPTTTPGSPFVLRERSQVCDQNTSQPMLQVQMNDAAGNPVAGIEILVSWLGGEDIFYTGLMPGINPGYADFQMTPGVSYTLHLTDGGQPVSGLAAVQCDSSQGTSYWGGWYLVLQQP